MKCRYFSNDGTEFSNMQDCCTYEKIKRLVGKSGIKIYLNTGHPLELEEILDTNDIAFVKIENPEDINTLEEIEKLTGYNLGSEVLDKQNKCIMHNYETDKWVHFDSAYAKIKEYLNIMESVKNYEIQKP